MCGYACGRVSAVVLMNSCVLPAGSGDVGGGAGAESLERDLGGDDFGSGSGIGELCPNL